ncbi:1,2-phenylacetyl-CoA epoxidase subunit PaaD [Streptomyces flaveus]|uniref:Phenylacetate-CoA oxygenase subunit PaaJ n=1 Tax=Streptomyces flaveus TaxID=66370 RepID=A0A917QRM7_9ACTN|nr:1,2-phenylacetyl-CoA epoxidase subunit PaaD [Streptomyces flaveus]GGK64164.1 phenylacetate-CoA oxygenase subunit PaaJ [Streptomyces flaveus]
MVTRTTPIEEEATLLGEETTVLEEELRRLAGSVPDPELPVLSLEELGVLRAVHVRGGGAVEVELTPTYTGCPAVEAMSADIARVLHEHGVPQVTVQTVLSPAWTTDDISDEGRRKLREFGIAPPRTQRATGPVPISLGPTRTAARAPDRMADAPPDASLEADPVRCPHCGSADTELLSRFSSTACKALRRCLSCREPFDHFKEL